MRRAIRLMSVLSAVASVLGATAASGPVLGAPGPGEPVMTGLDVAIHPDLAWMSADGRIVAMHSNYDYLVHFMDRATGQKGSIPIRTNSLAVEVVADGSAIVMTSPPDGQSSNWPAGIWRYPLPDGPLERLDDDVAFGGTPSLEGVSADGRLIALTIYGSSPYMTHVALFDTANGELRFVDPVIGGTDVRSRDSSISADGSRVAFRAYEGDCTSGCLQRNYVLDLTDNEVTAIDEPVGGGLPNDSSFFAKLSADGQHVVFVSRATNLRAAADPAVAGVFVRDLDTGDLQLISATAVTTEYGAASISGDGSRILLFEPSHPEDLVTGSGYPTPILVDRATGQRTHIIPSNDGQPPLWARWAKITTDGRTVYFRTTDANFDGWQPFVQIYAYGPTPTLPPPPTSPPTQEPSDGLAPVTPARVVETRSGQAPTVDGLYSGVGTVRAGTTLEVLVAGRAGVPVDASGVMLNVTAINPTGPGFLTVYPCDQPRPLAANVNYDTGDVVPNAVLAKIAATGKICVYTYATTDVVIDLNGYIAAT